MTAAKISAATLATALAAAALYLLFWPVPVEPQAWSPPPDPGLAGPFAENDALRGAERLFADEIHGPDFILADRHGRLVTGARDGRLMHLNPDAGTAHVLSLAGGRPLGIVHTPVDSYIVADPEQGLVMAKGRRRFQLVTDAGGTATGYASDVALTSRNALYFLDASARHGPGSAFAELVEHGGHGRLLRYDDLQSYTDIVLDGLDFPSGLAIGPDDRFLLISETTAYRVTRYWLSGEKAGSRDTFIGGLPGFPAHITWNGTDTFWLAMQAPRIPLHDRWADDPWLRKLLFRLPAALRPRPEKRAWVLGLDLDGNVVHNLQYAGEDAYAPVTSVREHDGWLYLGSLAQDGVARVRRPQP